MKSSTKDQVEGKLHEIKGKVKEAAGQVTNNPDLTNEGQAEKLTGKVRYLEKRVLPARFRGPHPAATGGRHDKNGRSDFDCAWPARPRIGRL